ncbi:MAG: rod shape-determining protein RodA [Nitrospirae bacterium]|nr:rod shape-determining protein RodA [Nitrospirota bacterium]
MFTVDRRVLEHMDWRLVALVLAILALGVTTIYSVTPQWSRGGTPLFLKQCSWAVVGVVAFVVFSAFDYQRLLGYAHYFYWATLALLVLVESLGRVGMGAQRWVDVGGVSLQPSELAKLSVTLMLARYFPERITAAGFRFRDLLVPGIYVLLPFGLILRQPDLGSALLVVFVFGVILLIVGLRRRSLVWAALLTGMGLPFLWEFFWNSLREYQRNRLLTFLNPGADPLGSGYHVMQSKIAIGAGGLAGQGFQQGTQSQLKFLPEGHTDFIFSVFAEQWGFLGVTVLLLLFAGLIACGMDIAMKAKDLPGMLVAAGVTCMLTFPIFINLGMTLGVAPVVGVPLPLMSYGGTALVTTMAALGILANVHVQRHLSLYR